MRKPKRLKSRIIIMWDENEGPAKHEGELGLLKMNRANQPSSRHPHPHTHTQLSHRPHTHHTTNMHTHSTYTHTHANMHTHSTHTHTHTHTHTPHALKSDAHS